MGERLVDRPACEVLEGVGPGRPAHRFSTWTIEQKRELLISLAARPAFEEMLAADSGHNEEGDAE